MSAHVIVIGAGVAGLSAATALAERGVTVSVLEARPSAGGRCSTFTDPSTGERVDNGQHVLFGCYAETFRFLRRIDAAAHVRIQDHLAVGVVDRAGHSSRLSCPSWPAPWHLAGGLFRWKALTWRDRIAPLGLLRELRRNRAGSGGRGTVREWLAAHGQTGRLIELLWEPLAVAALNQSIDEAAADPFRAVLQRMFTFDRRDAALALPVVPLHELFVAPSQSFLADCGGHLETGMPARIDVTEAEGVCVRVRDAVRRADAVICAVPWHALPDVLPPIDALRPIVDAARATAASAIVTVNLWFDRAITDEEFVGLPGRHMQWIFDKRRLLSEQASHLSCVSSGADAIAGGTNQEIVELALREVRTALPLAAPAQVVRAVVVREKRATFSVAPGQPARPATGTAVSGLFLAGDWIDTGLPATIESAILSGHRAADAASDYLERSPTTRRAGLQTRRN